MNQDKKELVIKTLDLFNKQFEKLKSSDFLKKLELEPSGASFKWKRGEGFIEITRKGPSDDEVKLFVIDIRLFMQNNESISFGNLADFCNFDFISDDWKEKFKQARDFLNDYLDSKSPYTHNREEIINKKLFDLFAYGDMTHLTQIDRYNRIVKGFPINQSIMMNDLVIVLINIFRAISHVANTNESEIKRIGEL